MSYFWTLAIDQYFEYDEAVYRKTPETPDPHNVWSFTGYTNADRVCDYANCWFDHYIEVIPLDYEEIIP